MSDFPRRIQMQQWCEAERKIHDAVDEVERMGADVRLTDAVVLLAAARDRVADFVDGVDGKRTVPVGAGDRPPACTGPNFHAEYNDLVATAEALAAEVEQLRGDRPPAPSAHTVIDFALDEIIRLGQEARPFVDEVAIAKHRGAIHDAVRAVRPTPRAALTVYDLAQLLFETEPLNHRDLDAWAAALLPRLGAASPAAAPPQEETK